MSFGPAILTQQSARSWRWFIALVAGAVAATVVTAAPAAGANSAPSTLNALPEVGVSVLRVVGALILVLALFLGAAWLYRNGQRLAVRRGAQPKLAVLETRSLGNRQALFVVGYDRHRLLLAASPGSISLVAHLPESDADEPADPPVQAPSFAAALQQMLHRR